jgi:hypothetical protein
MPFFRTVLRAATLIAAATLFASGQAPSVAPTPAPVPVPAPAPAPAPLYDPSIFHKTIAPADLADLTQHDGEPSGTLWRDRQFRKLVNSNTPDVMYHFGNDKPLQVCMDLALDGSRVPVQVRDNRYVLLGGESSMYGFHGRAFLWFDTQAGILLGGFYFNPTNGEPTPTLTVFSKQTGAPELSLGRLPPAFARDLADWTIAAGIPVITTRYFIDEQKKRILLEHDEDFCLAPDGTHAPVGDPCEQMNENAADIDLGAAEYLSAVHYATNATARMAYGYDRGGWVQVVNSTCGAAVACRIRIMRQRTRAILAGKKF